MKLHCPWFSVRLLDDISINQRWVVNECGTYVSAALFDIFALIFGSLSEVASKNILSWIALGIRLICIRVNPLTIHSLLVHYNNNYTCCWAVLISHKFDHFFFLSRVFLLIILLWNLNHWGRKCIGITGKTKKKTARLLYPHPTRLKSPQK